MHATAFFTALLGVSSAAAAALDKRVQSTFIEVTFYNDVNRLNSTDPNKALTLRASTGGTCTNFQSEPLDNRASSVRVPCGYYCIVYDDNNCGGNGSDRIYAPGTDNLAKIGFDDKPIIVIHCVAYHFVYIYLAYVLSLFEHHHHYHRNVYHHLLNHYNDLDLSDKHYAHLHWKYHVHHHAGNVHIYQHVHFDQSHDNLDRNIHVDWNEHEHEHDNHHLPIDGSHDNELPHGNYDHGDQCDR